MPRACIHIFLKAPRLGSVKTRLADTIGKQAALDAYRSLVSRQLSQIPENCDLVVNHYPVESENEMRAWLGEGYQYRPQCQGDLGEKLAQVTQDHFDRSDLPALLIGGDCPGLTSQLIAKAIISLQEYELCIGPSSDGGYYLLGMKAYYPKLFADIDWSTEKVFAQTIAQTEKLGLSWTKLVELTDVDDAKSWRKAQEDYPELGGLEKQHGSCRARPSD